MKSTDDSMLDNLEKISGIRHESYHESKSVTFDAKKMINPSDSKVTETTNIKEKPVISKNDMLLIPKANEMVFGKGNPIWDRNQMALPMAYMLHKKMPHASGVKGYQLNTVPSSSNTDDFDILGNQPNFYKMVAKRSRQARISEQVREQYKKVYGLSEDEMHRIKPDELAQQLMEGINENIQVEDEAKQIQAQQDAAVDDDEVLDAISQQDYVEDMNTLHTEASDTDGTSALAQMLQDESQDNTEEINSQAQQNAEAEVQWQARYAKNSMSRADIVAQAPDYGTLNVEVANAYNDSLAAFRNDPKFIVGTDDTLYSASDKTVFIQVNSNSDMQYGKDTTEFKDNETGQVTTLQNDDAADDLPEVKYHPTQDFYRYLVSLDNWDDIASGKFDTQMYRQWEKTEQI